MPTRFIGSCATRASLLTPAALALASVLGCTSPGSATPANESAGTPVRLVLQITVDGLRGDLLNRYGDRFGEGGFRHLLETGAVYANAHYQHANTETIVGHSTLATGASPDQHGMIGNVWFDREAGELAYNIEDPEHPILPSREVAMEGAQLDPSQKQSRTKGRSPRSLLASTFGDELSVHTAGRAKVFGVSGKDRSAVAMAGHVGKAFWYATDSGDMVTSDYYYDAYPDWVAEWNARRRAESHAGGSWRLLNDASTYLLAASDDRPYETDLKGYGRVFPHPFGELGDPLFFTRLIASPVGDALTLDFAKALIAAEQLGQDATPDYLSISFSSVDVVNHFFGPSSLENEDIVLQLDRTLSDLFRSVDATVGLERTLVVLSADHGTPEMPEAMAEAGLRASRLYPAEVVERANAAARSRFGIEGAVRFFFRPYLYLNREKIRTSGADPDEVEQVIAAALTDVDGIALAVARSALPTLTDDDLVARIRRNTHPSRSGDIYVAPEPYWFLYEKGPIAAAHGSPWRHDTFVPIIFAGPGIAPQTIHRLVHPTDVAPTLSGYLGVKPPSSAVGTPLEEILP
ncbi:MAG: alkaline phosphatase family protein [Deltaproteobacteria bacterium]|nr:alkaline phosphatase family protein [Deltaproteobacteria bacterium]